jgi:hypothetical protein
VKKPYPPPVLNGTYYIVWQDSILQPDHYLVEDHGEYIVAQRIGTPNKITVLKSRASFFIAGDPVACHVFAKYIPKPKPKQ